MTGLTRLSVFPLAGALLFPRAHLPLHIFEPRYRAMVGDALARDRRIAMVQPRGEGREPPLYALGCVGKIIECEALDDGRFNIILEGQALFRLVRELDVTTAFRQIEAELLPPGDTPGSLMPPTRAALMGEARRYADVLGYAVEWEAVDRLDDEPLVNGIAQIAPFDAAAKQALLEVMDLEARAALLIQLMAFFSRTGGEGRVTLQ